MRPIRLGGVAAFVAAAALAGGCEDEGALQAPPPPPLAEGREDPGPPSAIKASTAPSRRLADPGPRSAVSTSLKGGGTKKAGGSR